MLLWSLFWATFLCLNTIFKCCRKRKDRELGKGSAKSSAADTNEKDKKESKEKNVPAEDLREKAAEATVDKKGDQATGDNEREQRRKRQQATMEKLRKERDCLVKEALEKGNLRPADDNETINECQSQWNGPLV